MATVLASEHVKVTLHEFNTVYGLEDLWDLFEIASVARYNDYLAAKHANKK